MKTLSLGIILVILSLLFSIHAIQKNRISKKKSKVDGISNISENYDGLSSAECSNLTDSKRNSENMEEEIDPTQISFQLISRAIYLFFLFIPIILTSGFAYLSATFRKYIWFQLIAFAITGGGAAFIKWGQWASTRSDMFPEEFCILLSSLQSSAPQHSFSYTKKLILEELGHPVEQVFDYFPDKPIASGSIAQVYRAVYQGQIVAVKVRHPNVELHIRLDFTIMKAVAWVIEKVLGLSWLNLSESLSQFSHTIASQVHLDTEGYHLQQLNQNFHRWKDTAFPRPIVMTSSVLIESWEWGVITGNFVKDYTNTLMECQSERNMESNSFNHNITDGNMNTSESPNSDNNNNNNNNNSNSSISNNSNSVSNTSSSNSGSKNTLNSSNSKYEYSTCVNSDDLKTAHFLVTRGEDIYLKMLFQDNLMHADLHPGNIILQQSHQYERHQAMHQSLLSSSSSSSSKNTSSKTEENLSDNHSSKRDPRGVNNSYDSSSSSSTNMVIKQSLASSLASLFSPHLQRHTRHHTHTHTNTATSHSSHDLSHSVLESTPYLHPNKLVLVDAGMVSTLTEREQINFIGLLESIGEGDARSASYYLLDFSTKGRSVYSDSQRQGFEYDMKILFQDVCRGYGTNMDIGNILRGILNLIRIHQITIESNYATLVMNVLCLESMAKSLLPSYNVMDAAKPLLRFHRRLMKLPMNKVVLHRMFNKLFPLILWKKRSDDRSILRHLEDYASRSQT